MAGRCDLVSGRDMEVRGAARCLDENVSHRLMYYNTGPQLSVLIGNLTGPLGGAACGRKHD